MATLREHLSCPSHHNDPSHGTQDDHGSQIRAAYQALTATIPSALSAYVASPASIPSTAAKKAPYLAVPAATPDTDRPALGLSYPGLPDSEDVFAERLPAFRFEPVPRHPGAPPGRGQHLSSVHISRRPYPVRPHIEPQAGYHRRFPPGR